mmetsp:Transcript_20885/g.54928  ORF Transcript_20885/g.54928 Transcript_20885/m.54928 type:complete len:321 (-) Transcript_20885:307-1269(-)
MTVPAVASPPGRASTSPRMTTSHARTSCAPWRGSEAAPSPRHAAHTCPRSSSAGAAHHHHTDDGNQGTDDAKERNAVACRRLAQRRLGGVCSRRGGRHAGSACLARRALGLLHERDELAHRLNGRRRRPAAALRHARRRRVARRAELPSHLELLLELLLPELAERDAPVAAHVVRLDELRPLQLQFVRALAPRQRAVAKLARGEEAIQVGVEGLEEHRERRGVLRRVRRRQRRRRRAVAEPERAGAQQPRHVLAAARGDGGMDVVAARREERLAELLQLELGPLVHLALALLLPHAAPAAHKPLLFAESHQVPLCHRDAA